MLCARTFVRFHNFSTVNVISVIRVSWEIMIRTVFQISLQQTVNCRRYFKNVKLVIFIGTWCTLSRVWPSVVIRQLFSLTFQIINLSTTFCCTKLEYDGMLATLQDLLCERWP